MEIVQIHNQSHRCHPQPNREKTAVSPSDSRSVQKALRVVLVFFYTFGVTYLLYWLTNKMIPLRVSAASERVGLDRSQHNEHYGPETGGPRELAEYADAHADA